MKLGFNDTGLFIVGENMKLELKNKICPSCSANFMYAKDMKLLAVQGRLMIKCNNCELIIDADFDTLIEKAQEVRPDVPIPNGPIV